MKKTKYKLLLLILASNTLLFMIIMIVFNIGIKEYFIYDAKKTLENEIKMSESENYSQTYLSGNISCLYLDSYGNLFQDSYDDIDYHMQYHKNLNEEKSDISAFCYEMEIENRKFYQFETDNAFYIITALNDYIDETGLVMVMYLNIEPFLHYAHAINWIVFALYIVVSAAMGFIGLKTGKRIDSAHEHERTFFQNSSHELKTPLMSIQGYAEGINVGIQNPSEASAVILRESERMAKLVDELLYISKMDSGLLKMSFQNAVIQEIIYDSIRIAQPAAVQKSCCIIPNLQKSVIMAECDEEQMIRAISNIVVNAVYHAESDVRILCSQAADNIIIRIHNNGEPVPEEIMSHIFDRFYTGHKGGSGIGLSIASEVIKTHKGTIKVENECGGTTFIIIIPIKQ